MLPFRPRPRVAWEISPAAREAYVRTLLADTGWTDVGDGTFTKAACGRVTVRSLADALAPGRTLDDVEEAFFAGWRR